MESVNTFSKMNMDTDKSVFPKDSYYKGVNVRPVTTEGLSTGALVNIKGNEYSISIPDTNNVWIMYPFNASLITTWSASGGTVITDTGTLTTSIPAGSGGSKALMDAWKIAFEAIGLTVYRKDDNVLFVTSQTINITSLLPGTTFYSTTIYIPKETNLQLIGWETLNHNIYLITTPNTTSNPGNVDNSLPSTPTSTGQIWKLEYNDVDFTLTITLIYNNYLNLSTQHPIANPGQIESRHENGSVQRLYWTDYFNQPRGCNVADPNLFVLDPDLINLQPAINFSVPQLTLIGSGGQLQCGVYQFAYRLKNTSGSETQFSNFSNLVRIVEKDENTVLFPRYEGTPVSVTSVKSISMIIDNLDTTFDRLEIIRVYNSSINSGSPIIDIIYDDVIPLNGIYPFTYDGYEPAIPITINEVLVAGVSFNKVRSIASKNNILFYLNTSESNFDLDYDARAFRWQWSNSDAISTGTMNWANTLPEAGNDVNPNQSSITVNSVDPYIYQQYVGSGVPILGGNGTINPVTSVPNISYTFDYEGVHLDQAGIPLGAPWRFINKTTDTHTNIGGRNYTNISFYNSFHSPYLDNTIRGYTRDETYRFGIVFFNKKGQSSFVKWIADIRMPHMWMPDPATPVATESHKTYQFPTHDEYGIASTGSDTYGRSLGVKFTVNIPPNISKLISGFSIVRVKREQGDKSILGQGLIYPSDFQVQQNLVAGFNTSIYSNTIMTIQSPEFLFGSSPQFNNGDVIDILGPVQKHMSFQAKSAKLSNPVKVAITKWVAPPNYTGHTSVDDFRGPKTLVDVQAISSYTQNSGTISLFNNVITGRNADYPKEVAGPKTTAVYGIMNKDINGVSHSMGYYYGYSQYQYMCNYRRQVSTQYGGNTLTQKALNEYIFCGHYQQVNVSAALQSYTTRVFGGDTYITIFDNITGFKNWIDGPGGNQEHGYGDFFCVETNYNTELRIGTPHTNSDSSISYGTLNKGGFPDTGENIDIDEEFNLTSVYMSEPILKKYYPKPIPFTLNNENTNRIYASKSKINGEMIDSWSIVDGNTQIDVSGQYGPIINGIVNRDKLYYFQESGIGIVAINERALIDGNTTAQNVQLGTAGILSRYDYVSTNIGTKHQHSFTNTDEAIYFFDIDNKTIYKLSDQIEPLSNTKYVSSQLRNKLNGYVKVNDNPVFYNINTGGYRNGILTTYDYINKEIYFTFLDSIKDTVTPNKWTEDKFTLVYNDNIDAFTSFNTHYPAQYINTINKVITPNTSVKRWQFDDNQYDSATGYVSFMNLNNKTHTFVVGDKIQILQFPGYTNASYNTYATVTNVISNTQIVTDIIFGVSTPPQAGIIICPKNNDLYIHHIGDYGKFYNTINNSELTFISNDYSTDIKVFTNLVLYTESFNTNLDTPQFTIDVPADTFNTIRCFNDYQNSDYLPISSLSRRVERKWNLRIPNNRVTYTTPNPNFDIFDTNNILTTRKSYSDRLRSTHLFVDLLYNNTNNYKLVLHNAKTLFEKSYS